MQLDPTRTVDLSNPRAVFGAMDALLQGRFGNAYGRPLLEQATTDLARAFSGEYPGLLRRRIHDEYADADKFMRRHFGGDCPYDESIKRNISFLEELLASEQLSRLQRLPQRVIDAAA